MNGTSALIRKGMRELASSFSGLWHVKEDTERRHRSTNQEAGPLQTMDLDFGLPSLQRCEK